MSRTSGRLRALAVAATLAFLAVNVALALLRVLHDRMDLDEPQHLHIAWLSAQGQLVYRDFWDNHGPLYTLANGLAIAALDPAPGPELVVAFRLVSFTILLGILATTVALARTLGLGLPGALLAGALTSALFHVQDHGTELRPDPLQTLFWLGGLLLVARSRVRAGRGLLVGAGALFGLAVLTNAKAALGPAGVGLYLLLSPWLQGARWRQVGEQLLALAAGALPVVGAIAAWFWARGGHDDLWFHALRANFVVLSVDGADPRGWRYARFFLSDQLPLVLAAAAGAVLWARDAIAAADAEARARPALILVCAAVTTAGMATNLFPWFYLLFLPLLAVIGAYGVQAIAARLAAAGRARGTALLAVALALGAASLLRETVIRTPFADHPDWTRQQRALREMVATVPRSEPVAALWDDCPAYVFQQNVQYWWIAHELMSHVGTKLTGSDPFGRALVERLARRPVRFISGRAQGTIDRLPGATRDFIRARYVPGECVWRLRDDS